MSLKLEPEFLDDFLMVRIIGNLVWDSSSELDNYLEPLIRQHKVQGVILDLSEMHYIDSSGVGIIIVTHQSLCENNRMLALTGLKNPAKSVFQLIKLDNLLNIYPDTQAAMNAIRNHSAGESVQSNMM